MGRANLYRMNDVLSNWHSLLHGQHLLLLMLIVVHLCTLCQLPVTRGHHVSFLLRTRHPIRCMSTLPRWPPSHSSAVCKYTEQTFTWTLRRLDQPRIQSPRLVILFGGMIRQSLGNDRVKHVCAHLLVENMGRGRDLEAMTCRRGGGVLGWFPDAGRSQEDFLHLVSKQTKKVGWDLRF